MFVGLHAGMGYNYIYILFGAGSTVGSLKNLSLKEDCGKDIGGYCEIPSGERRSLCKGNQQKRKEFTELL
jgi:hypothetical protein